MKRIYSLFAFTLLMAFGACSAEEPHSPADDNTTPPANAVELTAPQPTIFTGSLTMNSFTLVWEAVEGAGSYVITLNDHDEITTSELFHAVSGLEPTTAYTVKMQALPANTKTHKASKWVTLTVTTANDPESDKLFPDEIPEAVIPAEYQLVWSDEFNTSELDLTKWLIEDNGNGGGNNELQYYDSRGVSMGEEPETGRHCLILTARKEQYRGKSASSGRINTSNGYTFTHGRVDALIRLPKTADGLWPAFWLLGADYKQVGWPRCGEIDILEMGNSTGIRRGMQERYFNGACHWGYYEGGGYPNYAKASDAPYSLQDGFHLFTLVWDDQRVATYLDLHLYPDAEPYFVMNIDDVSSDKSPGNYFHHDFFIIFNLAVGGNFTGIWDIDKVTALGSGEANMYVDYVRVYQKTK